MSDTRSTALVTGASVGIGRDLAWVCAQHGHDLVITARNQGQLDALATELRAKFNVRVDVISMDIAKPQAAEALFQKVMALGVPIGILINNAGFGGHGRFDREDIDEILGMLQLNIVTLTHLTRLFLPQMTERGRGRVMNVASVAAFQPGPLMAVYFATKAYVLSFSEAIWAELKRTGVTVTAVCPGPTATEFGKRAGIESAPAFHGNMMIDSMSVARIAYKAMMRGKRTSITGLRNKLLTAVSRMTPNMLSLSIIKKFNDAPFKLNDAR